MSEPAWLTELAALPLSERPAQLERLVAAEFRALLLLEASDELPVDVSFFALGLTSLGAVEIQETLERRIGRRIDSASLFNNPTIGQLLSHLRGDVLPELFAAAAAESAPVPATAAAPTRELVTGLLDELFDA